MAFCDRRVGRRHRRSCRTRPLPWAQTAELAPDGSYVVRTEAAILAVTGQRQLLAKEPVLLKSVQLRNPYIDPLNYIQVDMMRRLRTPATAHKMGNQEAEAVRAVIELTINGISGGL